MKLTLEVQDDEIYKLAAILAAINADNPFTATKECCHSNPEIPQSQEQLTELPPPVVVQSEVKRRGRPKKVVTPEVSTVDETVVNDSIPVPEVTVEVEPTVEQEPVYEPLNEMSTVDAIIPSVEEVRSALIRLSDAKGVTVAAQLCERYAPSRKANDVPENKRAELIAEAESLKNG